MKAVQLTDRIRYIHLPAEEEDQDSSGILIFTGSGPYPIRIQEVSDKDDFRYWFNKFKATEQRLNLESTLQV